MKLLKILLFLSFCFSQELKVEGNLNVTGAVINDSLVQVIDSLKTQLTVQQTTNADQQSLINTLQALISSLQVQIQNLQTQISLLGDNAGLVDCFGVVGGDAVMDCAGVCGDVACIVADIDGNMYETVHIGDQLWMAENLKVTHYNDGDEIQYVQQESSEPDVWADLNSGAFGFFDDNLTFQDIYGNLYNWYAVDDDRGICPEGWHVPSREEYTVLTDFLGAEAGGKMKEEGLYWTYYSNQIGGEATNQSGFTGLPAGKRGNSSGNYQSMGYSGFFWSSSENVSHNAWYRELNYSNSDVAVNYDDKKFGFSIRCIQD